MNRSAADLKLKDFLNLFCFDFVFSIFEQRKMRFSVVRVRRTDKKRKFARESFVGTKRFVERRSDRSKPKDSNILVDRRFDCWFVFLRVRSDSFLRNFRWNFWFRRFRSNWTNNRENSNDRRCQFDRRSTESFPRLSKRIEIFLRRSQNFLWRWKLDVFLRQSCFRFRFRRRLDKKLCRTGRWSFERDFRRLLSVWF